MPFSTVFTQMSSLLRILYLFYSVAHALPTESSYDLFDLPLTDSSSMTLDPTNLDFWNGGGDLQSQLDQFTISSAGAAPLSNIEPGSTDLLGSSLSFPNDPFQVVNSGCQANAIDSNEVAQDLFAISGAQIDARSDSKSFSAPKNSRRSDLTFGDILGDHEHVCPGEEVAACCATGGPEIVIPRPTQTRVRQGCITWSKL